MVQHLFDSFSFNFAFDSIPVTVLVSTIYPISNMSFDAIPVLDLSLSRRPDTKPAFLISLRDALLDVGFLYIKNTGIDDELIQDVIEQGKAFFSLPEEQKLEVQMKNVPSFLGESQILPDAIDKLLKGLFKFQGIIS